MTFTALEILYLALTVSVLSLTIPLTMILWRVYSMMDKVEKIVNFTDRMVGYAVELERIPLSIIEKVLGKK